MNGSAAATDGAGDPRSRGKQQRDQANCERESAIGGGVDPLNLAGEPLPLRSAKCVELVRDDERIVGEPGVALRSGAGGADP